MTDGTNTSNTATVTITLAANTTPVAVDDMYTIASDQTLTVLQPGITGNDTDADGDNLIVVNPGSLTPSTAGTLTVLTNGAVVFQPTAGFTGPATFTYQVTDGTATSNTATVTINVTAAGTGAIDAVDDTFTVQQDTTTLLNVLGNDTVPSNSTATITAVGTPSNGGTATVQGNQISYTPAAGFTGTETFTYTVSNGTGGTDTATVTVTVTPTGVTPNPTPAGRGTLPVLVVGGGNNTQALVFNSNTGTGQLPATPTSTPSPFGNLGTNVRVAAGDVDGDGIADTIVVTGPGTTIRVSVISGKDGSVLVAPFNPFPTDDPTQPQFDAGGFVAAGDIDGDGRAEFVVTPDTRGGPRVSIYSLNADGTVTRRANFFSVDPNFRGGARAALGDINNDGKADLVLSAGFGGGPRVSIIDGTRIFQTTGFETTDRLITANGSNINDFFAFPDNTTRNGTYLAVGDVNGTGSGTSSSGRRPATPAPAGQGRQRPGADPAERERDRRVHQPVQPVQLRRPERPGRGAGGGVRRRRGREGGRGRRQRAEPAGPGADVQRVGLHGRRRRAGHVPGSERVRRGHPRRRRVRRVSRPRPADVLTALDLQPSAVGPARLPSRAVYLRPFSNASGVFTMARSSTVSENQPQQTPADRRAFLGGGLAAALSAAFATGLTEGKASAQQQGNGLPDLFPGLNARQFQAFQEHENAHVDATIALIRAIGGTPRPKPTFQGLRMPNLRAFGVVSQALENTGVGAYRGAAPVVFRRQVLDAAASIALIEARHAGYLNILFNGITTDDVFGDEQLFEAPLTVDEVVNLANPFIASLNNGPPLTFRPTSSRNNDIDILNFSLTLEYLEADFYNINVPIYFPPANP